MASFLIKRRSNNKKLFPAQRRQVRKVDAHSLRAQWPTDNPYVLIAVLRVRSFSDYATTCLRVTVPPPIVSLPRSYLGVDQQRRACVR